MPPPTDAEPVRPTRVAIIGGGCAGLAAAWELSKQAGYEVSVYERSARLGGKGASGRTADGRIVEHGLHVWLGFYENAFRMIRECYAEVGARNWGPGAKHPAERLAHASFEDAFFVEPHIGVTGKNGGEDVVWSGLLPPEKGLPGDPIEAETNPFTVANYLRRCVHLLATLMLSVVATPDEDVPGRSRPESRSALDERVDLDFSLDVTRSPELLIQTVATRLRDGTLTLAAALLQAVTIFENVLQDLNHSPQAVGSILNLLKALAAQARKQLREVTTIDPRLRWKTEIIDIVMTIAVGLYRDRVLFGSKGLDAINDLDYRDWLRKHGATKTSLVSPFITGIYDLVFAYERGDRERPRLAAGVALRGALRMFFTYRGGMFWRMRSGMGDAVFAPLYKVMSSRSEDPDALPSRVSFFFRHTLDEVTFDDTGRFMTSLRFKVPRAAQGGHDFQCPNPADALDHGGCWRDVEPQMASEGRDVTLQAGEGFDFVILATGLDDFRGLVRPRSGKSRAPKLPVPWRRAVEAANQTVATTAAQVWLGNSLKELGWYRGSAIITALGMTFDTWADMTHTLPAERAWRKAAPSAYRAEAKNGGPADARSVAYFCGVLSDRDVADNKDDALSELIEGRLSELLPAMNRVWAATRPVTPRKKPPRTRGVKVRVLFRHLQTNVKGSDRYSLSLPGTISKRLSPLDQSVLNATVAGDWTACGLDAGCVEAAVMSGMLAAHAITGKSPALDTIVGYDHP